eukprot:GILK01038455.1.p1 GENE.GILK01038455.1~~GILK01038455.1.p1  ORF type:complete len:292 (-),score=77.18 GILK01038455.1:1-819(-)
MYAELIAELSSNAVKELSIEQALANISAIWTDLKLDIVDHKDVYWKIRGTDELFQALEENQVTLSAMKASSFYLPFDKQVEYWEHALTKISETVDMMLTVQRQWMYLESIFIGSADIRKQLAGETVLFDAVNNTWKDVMNRIHKNPNALQSTHTEGLFQTLVTMNDKLEKIQKSLSEYLETKRQQFPRFYFLSDDDLLEILGQSKDPMAVQKHIKKCFEGIKILDIVQPSRGGSKVYEALGMVAPDAEKVNFIAPVVVDGPVENWLIDTERK